MHLTRIALVALSATMALPAAAAPLTATELLNQFNLIAFGNVSGNSEVEGRTYVGGTITGNAKTFFIKGPQAPASAFDAVIVAGALSNTTLNVNNGGNLTVGGSVANATLEMNGGGTARIGGAVANVLQNQGVQLSNQAVDPGFADRFPAGIKATLEKASTDLATLPGVAPGLSGSRGLFNGATPTGGLTVYSTTLGFLAGLSELELGLNGADTLVVNVMGSGSLTWGANFLAAPFAAAPNVVWNFVEATSIALGPQFFGSILAPLADVSLTSNVEGTLVARNVLLGGEMHLQAFKGNIELTTPPAPIPLPAALPLLAAGLGVLGLVARRRSA